MKLSKNGLSVPTRLATWTRLRNFTQRGVGWPGASRPVGETGNDTVGERLGTPGTGGLARPEQAESLGRPPSTAVLSSVTVGRPAPPVSSRPLSGM